MDIAGTILIVIIIGVTDYGYNGSSRICLLGMELIVFCQSYGFITMITIQYVIQIISIVF